MITVQSAFSIFRSHCLSLVYHDEFPIFHRHCLSTLAVDQNSWRCSMYFAFLAFIFIFCHIGSRVRLLTHVPLVHSTREEFIFKSRHRHLMLIQRQSVARSSSLSPRDRLRCLAATRRRSTSILSRQ